MYKRLVVEEQIALSVSGFTEFPGARYPSLFGLYAQPRYPHTTEELETAIYEEIRLQNELVSEKSWRNITRPASSLRLGLQFRPGGNMAFYELFAAVEKLMDYPELIRSVTLRRSERRPGSICAGAKNCCYLTPDQRGQVVPVRIRCGVKEGGVMQVRKGVAYMRHVMLAILLLAACPGLAFTEKPSIDCLIQRRWSFPEFTSIELVRQWFGNVDRLPAGG